MCYGNFARLKMVQSMLEAPRGRKKILFREGFNASGWDFMARNSWRKIQLDMILVIMLVLKSAIYIPFTAQLWERV
jgi:hypothetical protein